MTQGKRIPVHLTDDERTEIEAAMKSEGLRTLADFLRFAALKLARS
jgi:uncharacterized protein (DUF1778 family)